MHYWFIFFFFFSFFFHWILLYFLSDEQCGVFVFHRSPVTFTEGPSSSAFCLTIVPFVIECSFLGADSIGLTYLGSGLLPAEDVGLLRTGIAWRSDKEIKFRNPNGNSAIQIENGTHILFFPLISFIYGDGRRHGTFVFVCVCLRVRLIRSRFSEVS